MDTNRVDAPTDQEAAADVIEHVAARGYVKEVHWPDVDVVLESGTGITAPIHRIMSASLFWTQGLLNTGDRFVYRITEYNGEITTTILPDPDARTRSPEEIDVILLRLTENARREFALMDVESDDELVAAER
jgi:hypothetical protein